MSDSKLINISFYMTGQDNGGEIKVAGLTGQECEILRASMLNGHYWVRRGKDGRLEFISSLEPLPGPITDEDMLPFWRKPAEGEAVQLDLFGFDESTEASLKHASPSIYITSLCGYDYSAENYRLQATKLTEWGFDCLRSTREPGSGRFWEVWYLSGVWAAKGLLEEAILDSGERSNEEKFKVALEFLRHNASFGSLDISIQRMAMVMD